MTPAESRFLFFEAVARGARIYTGSRELAELLAGLGVDVRWSAVLIDDGSLYALEPLRPMGLSLLRMPGRPSAFVGAYEAQRKDLDEFVLRMAAIVEEP